MNKIDLILYKHSISPLDYVILDKSSQFFNKKDSQKNILISKEEVYNKLLLEKNEHINIFSKNDIDISNSDIEMFLGYPFIKENIDLDASHLISNANAEKVNSTLAGLVSSLMTTVKNDEKYKIEHKELKSIFYNEFDTGGTDMKDLLDFITENHIKKSVYKFKETYLNFLDTGDELTNLYPSVINAILNQNLTTCDTDSPSATHMEIATILNIRKLVGYSYNFNEVNNVYKIGGCFTIGGMMGNILGVLTARNNKYKDIQKKGLISIQKKLYLIIGASHAHYSTWTGFGWLGFGEENVIHIPSRDGVMDTQILQQKIEEIYKNGDEVLLIISTLGNPYSMNFDNTKDVINIGKKYNIWTHCDAANGGILIFSKKYKNLIENISNFDSISLDFHKALGISYPNSLFLCKNQESFITNISEWNIINKPNSIDLGMTTPFVNSRSFDSFKLRFYLKYYGLENIGNKVDGKINNLKNLYNILSNYDFIISMTHPDSFGLLFLYIPTEKHNEYKNNTISEEEINKYQIQFKTDLKNTTGIEINSYKLPSNVFGGSDKQYAEVLSIHNSHENISYKMFSKLERFLSNYNK